MEFTFGSQIIAINMPTRAALLTEVSRRFREGQGFALATINLDHLAKLASDETFAASYAQHDLVVADGRPVVWLSRLAGRPVELATPGQSSVPTDLFDVSVTSPKPQLKDPKVSVATRMR